MLIVDNLDCSTREKTANLIIGQESVFTGVWACVTKTIDWCSNTSGGRGELIRSPMYS